MCIHSTPGFEWDPSKAWRNRLKHGVAFPDAVTALRDANALTIRDVDPLEERFVTLGLDLTGRLLVVVYTWREDSIRLISARLASKKETRQYESSR